MSTSCRCPGPAVYAKWVCRRRHILTLLYLISPARGEPGNPIDPELLQGTKFFFIIVYPYDSTCHSCDWKRENIMCVGGRRQGQGLLNLQNTDSLGLPRPDGHVMPSVVLCQCIIKNKAPRCGALINIY